MTKLSEKTDGGFDGVNRPYVPPRVLNISPKLRLPRQDIGGDDSLEKRDAVSLTLWCCTAERRPLGNIMWARKEVYRQSSILRHQVNHQVRKEPTSLAAVCGA